MRACAVRFTASTASQLAQSTLPIGSAITIPAAWINPPMDGSSARVVASAAA